MKLFLYSFAFTLSDKQNTALNELVGKKSADISMAVIDAAADAIPDSAEWVGQTHDILQSRGYNIEILDLKELKNKQNVRAKLADKDVIWVNAGNTFYLRWILRQTGADEAIVERVKQGAVYAGWSAGAIVAGPTLECIELMEDISAAPEVIRDGLGLTSVVAVPHIDNPDFADAAKKTVEALKAEGFDAQPLTDSQVLVIDGGARRVI